MIEPLVRIELPLVEIADVLLVAFHEAHRHKSNVRPDAGVHQRVDGFLQVRCDGLITRLFFELSAGAFVVAPPLIPFVGIEHDEVVNPGAHFLGDELGELREVLVVPDADDAVRAEREVHFLKFLECAEKLIPRPFLLGDGVLIFLEAVDRQEHIVQAMVPEFFPASGNLAVADDAGLQADVRGMLYELEEAGENRRFAAGNIDMGEIIVVLVDGELGLKSIEIAMPGTAEGNLFGRGNSGVVDHVEVVAELAALVAYHGRINDRAPNRLVGRRFVRPLVAMKIEMTRLKHPLHGKLTSALRDGVQIFRIKILCILEVVCSD